MHMFFMQAHKVLHGGVVDKEKGTRGYYAIVGSFIVMSFVLAVAGANSSAPFFLAVFYTSLIRSLEQNEFDGNFSDLISG